MCSATEKCCHLNAIILSYFLLFTISTLSYTPIYGQLDRDIDGHAVTDIRIPHLFLLELIGSEIMCHSATGNSQSACRFIFLKKRAVLPTENLVRKNQAQDNGMSTYSITMDESPTSAPIVRGIRTLQYALLLPFHSGISPPHA